MLTFAELTFNAQQTPVSARFDDIYFSTQDGLSESRYVFFEGNGLWQKWQQHARAHFVIAESGFGTGLNFFAVAEAFRQFRQTYPNATLKRLYFISFEKYPLTAEQLRQVHHAYPQFSELSEKLTACWQPRQVGCQRYHLDDLILDLWFGDILENTAELGDYHQEQIDCWFLDGFSPDKNPEMWNEPLYQQMFRLTRPGGSFATFTAASHVRRGLQAVGFMVNKRKGFGKKREMLWGEKPQDGASPSIQFPFYAQSPHTDSDDIAIIGGGIASLFVAWSLIARGKRVTLYCQDNEVAENASGNQQGAIYPQLSDDDARNVRFYLHSFDYARQRLSQLAELVHFEQQRSGVALCAYNDKTEQKLRRLCETFAEQRVITWLNAAALSEKIGLPVTQPGAFIHEGGWLSPQQLVKNGIAYLQTQGLTCIVNHHVPSLTHTAQGWQWQHQGQTLTHAQVICANGHQITQFSQAEGIPLYPVRGQVSHVPTNVTLQQLNCVVCYDGYLTPSDANRQHCLGASHLRDNHETAFSLLEHQQNKEKIQQNLRDCRWIQCLDLSANQGKVGIRAAFRDRMPMIGCMPDFHAQAAQYPNLYAQRRRQEVLPRAANYPNLYVIGGLGSRGLTTAPLLGELLASLICHEPLPLSESIWHALLPNRSWMRHWVKGRQASVF